MTLYKFRVIIIIIIIIIIINRAYFLGGNKMGGKEENGTGREKRIDTERSGIAPAYEIPNMRLKEGRKERKGGKGNC